MQQQNHLFIQYGIQRIWMLLNLPLKSFLILAATILVAIQGVFGLVGVALAIAYDVYCFRKEFAAAETIGALMPNIWRILGIMVGTVIMVGCGLSAHMSLLVAFFLLLSTLFIPKSWECEVASRSTHRIAAAWGRRRHS